MSSFFVSDVISITSSFELESDTFWSLFFLHDFLGSIAETKIPKPSTAITNEIIPPIKGSSQITQGLSAYVKFFNL